MHVPPDDHVHSEWSWDAEDGSMERTCARALDLGLPSVAFTEHVDRTRWAVFADDGGIDGEPFSPPQFDVAGYLECVQRCRERFPDLRIVTGVELGEPHWHVGDAARILGAGGFERVLGSLHALPHGGQVLEIGDLYRARPAAEVLRDYLAELPRLVEGCDAFEVLAHIDYPVRGWPAHAGPFDPAAFEDDFRPVLRLLAGTGRALEVNTIVPLHPQVVRWWHEEGGQAVTFGSDAHEPDALARGFADAAALVEACGFRPGRRPHDFWRR